MTAYDVDLKALDGSADVMANARGKVTLLVNVASKCGLTPQYEQLEQLQKDFGGDKFTVLGVPCNQFLEQEPGSADEIATFCSTTYGVTFPLSEKVEVNGEGRHALYEQLVDTADAEGHTGDIRWNFEKFLIGSDGSVITRFDPTTVPDDPSVVSAIEAAID
ncbi:MAG: glutathione peroxidase [Actinomycetia bacterium]|nr:glutathione peroxidase [Actinomycetes bacterium]